MDTVLLARLLVPAAALAFALFGLVWPIVRLWRRTGVFALTTARSKDLGERLMHLGLVGLVLAAGAFAALYATLGPERLGMPHPALAGLIAGAALLVAGAAIVIVAQAQMGRSWRIGIDPAPTNLVTHGLYRWVRSPIYTGLLAFVAGLVVVAPAWPVVAIWPVCLLVLSVQARREEAHLARLHPDEFAAWAAGTGRFLPGIGRLRRR